MSLRGQRSSRWRFSTVLRPCSKQSPFKRITPLDAIALQRTFAMTYTYASQNSFFNVQINWKAERQDGHVIPGEEQSAFGKSQGYPSGRTATRTSFHRLVGQSLCGAQTGCCRRGDVCRVNPHAAYPGLRPAEYRNPRHVEHAELDIWLGNLHPACCPDLVGDVANPAPHRKTPAAFA